jgi:hypothetical protein
LKIVFYIIIISFFASCNQSKSNLNLSKDSQSNDKVIKQKPIYERKWINLAFSEIEKQEVELYISQKNDSIINQYKSYSNNQLDINKSNFYDLEINSTSKPNIYKASIKYQTEFNVGNNKNIKTELYLSFREETKDSTFFTQIIVKDKNNIEFEYTNIKNNGIQGIIIKNIEIDTIIQKEKMVRMIEYKALIDNHNKTLNYSLESFGFSKENVFRMPKIFKNKK